jgi:kojibiose phosphorylase
MIKDLLSEEEWLIVEDRFEAQKNPFYETLFTLANGYVGVRGTLEHGSQTSHPGTFFAGLFDATLDYFTELANAPNWIGLKVEADGETLFSKGGEILDYKRYLDMKKGILSYVLRWKSKSGKITRFECFRLVHLLYKHLSLIKGVIIPENYSGTISLKGGINGYIFNTVSSNQIKVKHFKLTEYLDREMDGIYLAMKTYNSTISVGEASKLQVQVSSQRKVIYDIDKIEEVLTFQAKKGKSYKFEKFVTFYTSRDTKNVKTATIRELKKRVNQGIQALLQKHVTFFKEKWKNSDIKIDGDDLIQKSLRFNIFHLIQLANPNDEKVSLAAKGLHGEGYRGHVFWDTEIFMLPFYIYTNPKAARSMLMYRYNTLSEARKNARMNGYQGVQFAWESADTGEEVTPKEIGDPITGKRARIWTGEEQHHIVADVAFGVYQYYIATKDEEFMENYGAEILIDTTRFWVSRVEYNKEKKGFVINKVIGPDEFHPHINNSVFTNYIARWNINKTHEYILRLKKCSPAIWKKLKEKKVIENSEIRRWRKVADNIYIPYDKRRGLLEQFEGYFKLKDIMIKEYNDHHMPIIPKDFKPEMNVGMEDTTLIKQADVVMLLYLLNDEFDSEMKKRNYNYYESRTTHKSSLSQSISSIMGIEVGDYKRSYKNFLSAVRVDLDNNQGNTASGIHSASLGGTWQTAISGFAGMRIKNNKLTFQPHLPEQWKRMEFNIFWRGKKHNVKVNREKVQVLPIKQ